MIIYLHAECDRTGIYIDLKAEGEIDPEIDLDAVPLGCIACGQKHIAHQVTAVAAHVVRQTLTHRPG